MSNTLVDSAAAIYYTYNIHISLAETVEQSGRMATLIFSHQDTQFPPRGRFIVHRYLYNLCGWVCAEECSFGILQIEHI